MDNALLCFEIVGDPIPKERPRRVARRDGKGMMTFTPKNTQIWEAEIRRQILIQYLGEDALTEDLGVCLFFRRKTARACDVDNLAKAVLDSLNGILWKDDSQVVGLSNFMMRKSLNPGVSIAVMTAAQYRQLFPFWENKIKAEQAAIDEATLKRVTINKKSKRKDTLK